MIVDKIANEIRKYKNVELIDIPEKGDIMEFRLYDYDNKGIKFENDIECILSVIDQLIPTNYTFEHSYDDNEKYWNGEEMVDSNLYCTITVKKVGE